MQLTVQHMRPLEAPYSSMPSLAREATLALVRVPPLNAVSNVRIETTRVCSPG